MGVEFPFIQAFLAQHAIENIPKINPTLPENLPDPEKTNYVDDEALAIIQQISQGSLGSAVAIYGKNDNVTEIDSGIRAPNAAGVLIADDLVLTVMHVLDGRQTVTVTFKNGEVINNAITIAVSPHGDFGLIKLPTPAPAGYTPASIAFGPLQNNEPTYTVGHPIDLWYSSGGWQVTAGMTTGTGEGLLKFYGKTGGGNSGGGIFNTEGHVAGVLASSGYSDKAWSNDRQDPHETSYNPTIQPYEISSSSSDFGYLRNLVMRYSPDSLISLPSITNNYVSDLLIQNSNRFILTGWENSSAGNQIWVKSFTSDGKPDVAFADNGVFRTTLEGNNNRAISAVSVETDKLLIGINTGNDSNTNFGILRLKSDGTLDSNFGTDGLVIAESDSIDQLQQIAIQPDGKVLLGGTRFNGETVDILIARYNEDGSIDQSFGNNGTVSIDIGTGSSDFLTDIALDSNSNILASGHTDSAGHFDIFVSRFDAAGNLDTSFGTQGTTLIDFGGNDAATDLLIQEDGKIIVVGRGDNGMRTPTLIAARLLDSGILDDSFSGDGTAIYPFGNQNPQHHIEKVLTKGDGGLLVLLTGYQSSLVPEASRDLEVSLFSIKSNGEIDLSYGINGQVYFDSTANDYAADIEELNGSYYIAAVSDSKGKTVESIIKVDSNLVLQPDYPSAFSNVITHTDYVNGQYVGMNMNPITGTQGPDIIHIYRFDGPAVYALAGNDIVMRHLDVFYTSSDPTTIDGGSGIDTVIFDSPASAFSFTAENQAFNVVPLIREDTADKLIGVERLKFTDTNVAIDLDGNAGKTAKILGVVLGAEAVSNKVYVGAGLYFLDGGMTYEELMQAALDVVLGANPSSSSVVDLLWTNIVGPPTPADNLPQYSALIDNGTYTAAELAVAAADHSLNTTNIDLVGLSQTGLEYDLYG
ncbi:MAG: trypsin-like peptidase domain-containing protein, partial [Dehalococcoidia bacterium]|nr:trypsin-like peptidase domain-containing protein [Dehalococcoidia bacterium]